MLIHWVCIADPYNDRKFIWLGFYDENVDLIYWPFVQLASWKPISHHYHKPTERIHGFGRSIISIMIAELQYTTKPQKNPGFNDWSSMLHDEFHANDTGSLLASSVW